MITAIHQPNFLPWLGYFHKMLQSDVFVFFDDVQFPRGRSYCSRVKIKSPGGEPWLTVPVEGKSSLPYIKDIKISRGHPWIRKHLKFIAANYRKAPYFNEVYSLLEEVYSLPTEYLADLNIALIEKICSYMGIKTRLIRSSQLNLNQKNGVEHILDILKTLKADTYITGCGSGTNRYVEESTFSNNGLKILFQKFIHPVYPQQWGDFIGNLSIIDLLFNCGKQSLLILEQSTDKI